MGVVVVVVIKYLWCQLWPHTFEFQLVLLEFYAICWHTFDAISFSLQCFNITKTGLCSAAYVCSQCGTAYSSNQSISSARWAHSSKPAAVECSW